MGRLQCRAVTRSLGYSFIARSLAHSLTHSRTHSLTHSLTNATCAHARASHAHASHFPLPSDSGSDCSAYSCRARRWQEKSKFWAIMFKVVKICLWCFEKCLKFITYVRRLRHPSSCGRRAAWEVECFSTPPV